MTANRITPGLAGAPTEVDVVVIGLGITGAGVALDAVTRGLSVLAVDAHDLAFGTSRWSSKLVHGGLRYLAAGQVGVAHESAVERGILMEVTAPHLTHAIPTLMPFGSSVPRHQAVAARAATWAGDLLRRGARHQRAHAAPAAPSLRRPRRSARAPAAREGLRGAMLGWDGQLEDDARLVTTVARTAASYGAHVRTRARVVSATGTSVELRDELTGASHQVTARTVVNATGVWAGDLVDEVRLRPSRGTHLVLRGETLPGLQVVGLRARSRAPSTGSCWSSRNPTARSTSGSPTSRPTGRCPTYPSRPSPRSASCSTWSRPPSSTPCTAATWSGAFAGLRPLLDIPGEDETADISRRHAVLTSRTGVVTIVGGKLTTYRRMAEDALDAAVAARRHRGRARAGPAPCRCSARPTASRSPGWSSRPGWCAATAPTPRSCSRPPARSPGSPTTSCSRRSPRACRSRWPSWSSASPTRARPTSPTCSTAGPASAWSPPTGALAVPAAERALALVARRLARVTHRYVVFCGCNRHDR